MIGATGPNVSVGDQPALRTDVVEHRRCQQRAVALAAEEQLRAVGDRVLDALLDRDRGALVDHRADVGRLVERIADAQRGGARRDPLGQLIGDRLHGDDPLDRRAALARVPERARDRQCRSLLEVGVRRARSAGRCRRARAPPAGSRGASAIDLPTATPPVNEITSTAGVGQEGVKDLSRVAADHLAAAGGQAGAAHDLERARARSAAPSPTA